jgi:hypothetical protein
LSRSRKIAAVINHTTSTTNKQTTAATTRKPQTIVCALPHDFFTRGVRDHRQPPAFTSRASRALSAPSHTHTHAGAGAVPALLHPKRPIQAATRATQPAIHLPPPPPQHSATQQRASILRPQRSQRPAALQQRLLSHSRTSILRPEPPSPPISPISSSMSLLSRNTERCVDATRAFISSTAHAGPTVRQSAEP